MNNLDFNAACLDVGLKPKLGPYSLEAPRRVGDMWGIVDNAWRQNVPDCVAAVLNADELERVLLIAQVSVHATWSSAKWNWYYSMVNGPAGERFVCKREALLAAYKAVKEKK